MFLYSILPFALCALIPLLFVFVTFRMLYKTIRRTQIVQLSLSTFFYLVLLISDWLLLQYQIEWDIFKPTILYLSEIVFIILVSVLFNIANKYLFHIPRYLANIMNGCILIIFIIAKWIIAPMYYAIEVFYGGKI
jgi:hypothetical protein